MNPRFVIERGLAKSYRYRRRRSVNVSARSRGAGEKGENRSGGERASAGTHGERFAIGGRYLETAHDRRPSWPRTTFLPAFCGPGSARLGTARLGTARPGPEPRGFRAIVIYFTFRENEKGGVLCKLAGAPRGESPFRGVRAGAPRVHCYGWIRICGPAEDRSTGRGRFVGNLQDGRARIAPCETPGNSGNGLASVGTVASC